MEFGLNGNIVVSGKCLLISTCGNIKCRTSPLELTFTSLINWKNEAMFSSLPSQNLAPNKYLLVASPR